MAVDPLFEGLISIQVEDNDAPGRLGAIISQLQAKMAELGHLPGVQLGEQLFGSVEEGAKATLGVLDQLQVAMEQMRTAGQGMDPAQFGPEIAQMREMVAGTEMLTTALQRLMIVQREEEATAAQAAKAQRDASHWGVNRDYDMGGITPEELAARNALTNELEARNAAARRPSSGAAYGRVTSPEERQAALEATAARNASSAAAAGYRWENGVAVPLGSGGPGGGFPGGGQTLEEVKAQIAATTPIGEGTPMEEAQAKLLAARSRLIVSIDNEALVGDKRTAAVSSGIGSLIAADRKLMAAKEAEVLAAEKAAAATTVAPNLSGIDVTAPAKIQQLQLDQSIAVAKEQTLLAVKNGTVTEVELTQARIKTLAVQERLTAAMESEAGASGGGGGGGMSSLSMLKYYAFFMVFQEGSRLLGDVKKATEEYSLAVNQLSIALGGNQEHAQNLAATYSTIGQNLATAPAVAVDAATKYTRFFRDQSGVSGQVGATLGSTVNLLEGAKASGAFGDPAARAIANDKTLGELGAIAQNYERDAAGASKLYDAATVIAQHYGQQLGGSLLGGTSQIADLLKQSGFTAEQGLALTGSVMQYTGNTSEQAAGDLKRFLGRQGSATFNDVFAEFQINQNQSLRDELVQLGSKFATLSETQRAKVISTLGGGRAGAAVVAAITDLPDQTAIAATGADAIGAAAEQAQQRLGTFAGRLEQIGADWSTLSKDLGTSGLGLVFGDALALVDPLLRGVDALVNGFALLPGYVKQFLEMLALASVAGRAFGGSFGLEGVTAMLTRVGSTGAGATAGAEVAVTAEQTATRVAATAALAAEAEAQVALTATTWTAVEATVTHGETSAVAMEAVAALTVAEESLAAASTAAGEAVAAQAVASAASLGAAEVGTVSLIARLGSLGGAAVSAALAIGPFVEIIAGIAGIGEISKVTGEDNSARQLAATAALAHTNAKTLNDHASAADLADQAATSLQGAHEGIAAGLIFGGNRLPMYPGAPDQPTGYDSLLQQLQGQQSADYRASLTPAQQTDQDLRNFSLTHTASASQGLSSLAPGVATTNLSPTQMNFAGDYTDVPRGINALATMHASVSTSLAQLRDELKNIPDSSLADLLTPQPGSKGVGDEIKRLTTQIGRSGDPTQREAGLGQISSYTAELASRAAGTPSEDAAAAFYDSALKAYHQSVLSNVKAKVDSVHAMSSNNASSQAQIRTTVTAALREMARSGDVDSVIALLAGVDKAFITSFNANIAAERKVLADQEMALEVAAGNAANAAIAASTDPRQQAIIANRNITAVSPAEKALQDKIANDVKIATTLAKASGLAAPSGSDFTWPKDKAATGPTAAQIEEARLGAQAIPGDPMSAAITNLRVAQYKMSEPKNQVEYWQALKALHEAQYAYSMAQTSAANDATQLHEDLTNPLVVAREKVREAAALLIADQGRGALSDVTNKDKLALKQAQSAAEKTAFDQQFSDQQTNYNLQRESLSAYLSYLHAQHTYLTSVHSKTRQQVDELTQVDQALQGLANQLQGQFNLGQIKVPTAYEVRAVGGGGLTTNVQITINGTDINSVKQVLTQYLGQGVMSTAGSSARKV